MAKIEEETLMSVKTKWKDLDIEADSLTIDGYSSKHIASLPDDFRVFYSVVNGMKNYDSNGFLFYSKGDLITMGEKFKLHLDDKLYNIILFIDYMYDSWWYGVRYDGKTYEIGKVPSSKKFQPITSSLEEFLIAYLNDSDTLYEI